MKSLFVTFFFLLSFTAYGQVPNIFTSGSTISSSQMNANFTYFDTAFWQKNSTNLVYTAGNVGIGTTTPVNQLQIQNTGGTGHTIFSEVTFSSNPPDTSMINLVRVRGTSGSALPLANGDQLGQLRFSGESGSGYIPVATISAFATGSFSGSSTPSAMLFHTTAPGSVIAAERMRITDQGFVGIGTNGPLNMLHVKNADFETNIQIENGTSTGSARIIHKNGTSEFSSGLSSGYWNVQEGLTERMMIDLMGRVGIGTSAPAAHLHVAGDIKSDGFVTIVNDLTVMGNIYGTVAGPSDVSLKKNIEVITNPIEKIMGLKGVTYDWKDSKTYGSRHQMGVIAQDVQKQFPEAVTKRKDGILTVSYQTLVAPLIEAVKNLHVRLLKLENQGQTSRLPASEEKLKKLEAENASMKAYLCQKDPAAPFCSSKR